jgi:hypothetical protein
MDARDEGCCVVRPFLAAPRKELALHCYFNHLPFLSDTLPASSKGSITSQTEEFISDLYVCSLSYRSRSMRVMLLAMFHIRNHTAAWYTCVVDLGKEDCWTVDTQEFFFPEQCVIRAECECMQDVSTKVPVSTVIFYHRETTL